VLSLLQKFPQEPKELLQELVPPVPQELRPPSQTLSPEWEAWEEWEEWEDLEEWEVWEAWVAWAASLECTLEEV